MLDYDVILFQPSLRDFKSTFQSSYKGKLCLSEDASFQFMEAVQHWTSEIKNALVAGSTVIMFLPSVQEFYVHSGQKNVSGTGRSRHVTNVVSACSTYKLIPFDIGARNAQGSSIMVTDAGRIALMPQWDVFLKAGYETVMSTPANIVVPWLTLRGNAGVVGGIVNQTIGGALVLLPTLNFTHPSFFVEDELEWSDRARKFAADLLSSALEIDKRVHADSKRTPEPPWAGAPSFSFIEERRIQSDILNMQEQIRTIQERLDKLRTDLVASQSLRALLFETGKPLEAVILQALKVLGFAAETFQEGESEFDAVFERDGKRLLGEAEGKDSKAINVDKLRQLAMNINEDLQREEVSAPAKGVLFGNGFRLTPPSERSALFTEKCISAASAQAYALIGTPALFEVARYLSEQDDAGYATACRDAIFLSNGVVTFPPLPEAAPENSETRAEMDSEPVQPTK